MRLQVRLKVCRSQFMMVLTWCVSKEPLTAFLQQSHGVEFTSLTVMCRMVFRAAQLKVGKSLKWLGEVIMDWDSSGRIEQNKYIQTMF